MAANPNDDAVASLTAQIQAGQQQITAWQSVIAECQRNITAWNQVPNPFSASASAARAQWVQRMVATQAQIDAMNSSLGPLQSQLTAAQAAQSQFNDALSQAAAQGLTGDAAVTHAQALVAQAKGQQALMIGAAIALVVVVIAILVWLKHRKKK